MITRLAVKNFKSLRDVDLKLGLFNIFIGTNASGKSNFIDALRVLQGIGNGFTFNEILDGKPKSATSEVWEGIRGGSQFATWAAAPNESIQLLVEHINGPDRAFLSYEIIFFAKSGRLQLEKLSITDPGVGSFKLFDSSEFENHPNSPALKLAYLSVPETLSFPEAVERHRPVVSQMAQNLFDQWSSEAGSTYIELSREFSTIISNSQKIDLSVQELREYSKLAQAGRIGERGENFAALVQTICEDPKRKEAYVSWLKELRPHEVDDVEIMTGAIGEPLFAIRESGKTFPAKVLSDGTLRFAALAAAMFQSDKPELTIIEEIENGIHPQRMRLLVELLRSQTAESQKQVIVTTHSPALLDWLKETEYQYAFLCKRDEETGESRILPLSEIPNFFEVIKTTPPSELFTEGWFEAAS